MAVKREKAALVPIMGGHRKNGWSPQTCGLLPTDLARGAWHEPTHTTRAFRPRSSLPSNGFFSTAGDPSLLTRVHPYRDNQAIGKCKEVKNGRDQEDG